MQVQLAGIGLAQEGVQLFDQAGYGSFFVHRLIRQRAEVRTQCSDHPAGQVKVALVGGLQMFLDGNHLLLTDKTMPATQRLGVDGAVSVVLGHVVTHDGGSVLGDIKTGFEAVLSAHAGDGLRVDSAPAVTGCLFKSRYGFDVVLIS
jgi:hypothetical protein